MNGIIFHNLIDKINKVSLNINKYFDNFESYDSDIFNIFIKLPNFYYILYILIIFLIFNFISKFEIRLNDILTFFISIIVIYFLIRINFKKFNNYTKTKELQLDFLHKLMFDEDFSYALKDDFIIKPTRQKSYLYIDPLIVEFFYEIREYSQYNISSFVRSLFHCNNILSIIYDSKIGLNREYLNYETVIFETKGALNELSSVLYNTPNNKITFNKFRYSITKLHKILNQHIYDFGNLIKSENKLEEINLYSRPDNFYDEYFFISPNDTKTLNYQPSFNLY
jgi:hypothetical protein